MKAAPKIVPDFEMIICPPAESFRWNSHDYPFFGAKWHYHPEFELHLTRTTSGVMMVGDYVGEFEPGCLVLAGPNVPHNWISDIEPGRVVRDRDMLIQFSPEWAEKVTGFCPELATLRPLFGDAAHGVEFLGDTAAVGQRLLGQIGSAQGAERILLFLQLMTRLARDPAERRTLSQLAPTCEWMPLPPELDVALRYVLDQFSERVDLGLVASGCGMEPQAFSRFFKRHTGHTFARYVILARIYAACSLLTQTYRPITDICFEVGFNSIANFNRQFLKICAERPRSTGAARTGSGPRRGRIRSARSRRLRPAPRDSWRKSIGCPPSTRGETAPPSILSPHAPSDRANRIPVPTGAGRKAPRAG